MKTLKRVDPILIQAFIAAALSFAHIHDIAEAAGQGGWKAWAYPVSVDLLMVMAWRQIRATDGRPKGAPWFWFLLSLAASLGANIATSGVLDLENVPVGLRVLVAGWPAVAFLGGSLLVHRRSPDEPQEAPAPESQASAVEPVVEPAPAEAQEPVRAPEEPFLVSYAEAADALDVAPETVRGWKAQGKVNAYPGPTTNSVLVDLRECQSVKSRRLVSA